MAVTLATGRTFAGVAKVVGSIDVLQRIPLVLYNGSVVMQPPFASLITCMEIDVAAIEHVIIETRKCGADAFIYCIHREFELTSQAASAETVHFVGAGKLPALEFNGMPVREGWNSHKKGKPVAALLSASTVGTLNNLRDALGHLSTISVTQSSSKYLEIRPSGATKAVGIAALAKHLNILADNVLAVGDNDNDVELLEWAGLSVCVAGASKAAQGASRYSASYGAERGAIEVLDLVRRAQRLFKRGRRRGTNGT